MFRQEAIVLVAEQDDRVPKAAASLGITDKLYNWKARFEMERGYQSPNRFLKGSHELYRWLSNTFGKISDMVNKPIPDELGFDWYRTIWQWEVYRRIVLFSCNAIQTTLSKNIRPLH